jgi:hypothetical protein
MKTNLKSLILQYEILGKIFRVGPLVVFLALNQGCSSMRSKSSGYAPKEGEGQENPDQKDYSKVPEEYSLKEDRSYLDQLRSDTPEDLKKENDELAFIMKMMGEVRERPDKIRDRFQTEIRKRRERFNKLNQKDREAYNAKEKKDRESFLKELTKKRDDFVKDKPKSDERRDFFNEQDTKRRDYFAAQSDKRREFESQMRERSTDFEAYIREKQADFNQEHRAYSDRFRQYEKDKKTFDEAKEKYEKEQRAKGIIPGMGNPKPSPAPEASKSDFSKDLEEFNNIPKTPADKLKSGDGKGQ